jgi:hypothetical protein
MLNFYSLFPIVFENLPLRFLILVRKVEIPESCPRGIGLEDKLWGQLLVN